MIFLYSKLIGWADYLCSILCFQCFSRQASNSILPTHFPSDLMQIELRRSGTIILSGKYRCLFSFLPRQLHFKAWNTHTHTRIQLHSRTNKLKTDYSSFVDKGTKVRRWNMYICQTVKTNILLLHLVLAKHTNSREGLKD